MGGGRRVTPGSLTQALFTGTVQGVCPRSQSPPPPTQHSAPFAVPPAAREAAAEIYSGLTEPASPGRVSRPHPISSQPGNRGAERSRDAQLLRALQPWRHVIPSTSPALLRGAPPFSWCSLIGHCSPGLQGDGNAVAFLEETRCACAIAWPRQSGDEGK